MLPLPAISFFLEMEHNRYSIADYHEVYKYQDFTKTPWNVFYKVWEMSNMTTCFCIMAFVYGLFSLIDLVFYYLNISFPLDTLKLFRKNKRKRRALYCFAPFFLAFEWSFLFLVVALLTGYICLVLVWALLGAILNPSAYLAYAAAAGTFITYVNVKIVQLKELHKLGLSAIQEILLAKLKGFTDNIMKKILTKTGLSADMVNEGLEIAKNPNKLQ